VNRIAESNENNNKLTQTLTVGSSTALTPVVQIDSGSNSAVAPFSADVDFNTGNEFSSGTGIDLSAAANPAPAAVYRHAGGPRRSAMSYPGYMRVRRTLYGCTLRS